MQKLDEEKRQSKEKKTNILVWLFVTIVIFLSITRVLIANQLVGTSEKLHNLDSQIQKLQSDNEIRSEDLRKKESLLTLETKTRQLGFTQTNKYSFLKPSDPVALANESDWKN